MLVAFSVLTRFHNANGAGLESFSAQGVAVRIARVRLTEPDLPRSQVSIVRVGTPSAELCEIEFNFLELQIVHILY